MLSKMSYVYHNESDRANKLISSSMDLTFLISTSCMFGVLAIAKEFVFIYYGENFIGSGPVLMTLVPTILMYGWANVLRMQYIIPNNLDTLYIKSTFAGAAVNLILNIIFIPKFHAVGAALGTIAAQLTVALFYTFSINKKLPFLFYLRNNLFLCLIGFVMFCVVKVVQQFHSVSLFFLIIDIIVGAVTYGILLFVYGLFSKKNLTGVLVQGLIKKINRV